MPISATSPRFVDLKTSHGAAFDRYQNAQSWVLRT